MPGLCTTSAKLRSFWRQFPRRKKFKQDTEVGNRDIRYLCCLLFKIRLSQAVRGTAGNFKAFNKSGLIRPLAAWPLAF
jgi:hypothetical protein